MADDINFIEAMMDVRRLTKRTSLPATAKQEAKRQSNPALRAQIRRRAQRSAMLLAEHEMDSPRGSPHNIFGGSSSNSDDSQLFYLRAGVQKKVLRDLKKGQRYPARETLDLHGLTQAQAQQAIDQSVQGFHYAGLNCLLIIHGKGLSSAQGPVLKRFTAGHLKTLPEVRAYCSASIQDGDTGALYVLLKGGR